MNGQRFFKIMQLPVHKVIMNIRYSILSISDENSKLLYYRNKNSNLY
jgi:hypothetical protein